MFLAVGAGWPSPLRGSVSLDGFIPMLRIGPSRLEPAFYAEPYPDRDNENEKGPLKGPFIHLVAGLALYVSKVPRAPRDNRGPAISYLALGALFSKIRPGSTSGRSNLRFRFRFRVPHENITEETSIHQAT